MKNEWRNFCAEFHMKMYNLGIFTFQKLLFCSETGTFSILSCKAFIVQHLLYTQEMTAHSLITFK